MEESINTQNISSVGEKDSLERVSKELASSIINQANTHDSRDEAKVIKHEYLNNAYTTKVENNKLEAKKEELLHSIVSLLIDSKQLNEKTKQDLSVHKKCNSFSEIAYIVLDLEEHATGKLLGSRKADHETIMPISTIDQLTFQSYNAEAKRSYLHEVINHEKFLQLQGERRIERKLHDINSNELINYTQLCVLFGVFGTQEELTNDKNFSIVADKLIGKERVLLLKAMIENTVFEFMSTKKKQETVKKVISAQKNRFTNLDFRDRTEFTLQSEEHDFSLQYHEIGKIYGLNFSSKSLYRDKWHQILLALIFEERMTMQPFQELNDSAKKIFLEKVIDQEKFIVLSEGLRYRRSKKSQGETIITYRGLCELYQISYPDKEGSCDEVFEELCKAIFGKTKYQELIVWRKKNVLSFMNNDEVCDYLRGKFSKESFLEIATMKSSSKRKWKIEDSSGKHITYSNLFEACGITDLSYQEKLNYDNGIRLYNKVYM